MAEQDMPRGVTSPTLVTGHGAATPVWGVSPVALLPSVITVRPPHPGPWGTLLRWRDLHQVTLEAGLGWGYPGSPHSPQSPPFRTPLCPGVYWGPEGSSPKCLWTQLLLRRWGEGREGREGERGKGAGTGSLEEGHEIPSVTSGVGGRRGPGGGRGGAGGGTGGARGPSGPGGPEVRRPRP